MTHASWRMFTAMPDITPPDVLCAAFLYAADQGWLLPDLADRAVPADMPHAVEFVRARQLFLRISRTTQLPPDLLLQVLEAVPAPWHRFTPTIELLHRLSHINDDDGGESDRYTQLCIRAVRAQDGA